MIVTGYNQEGYDRYGSVCFPSMQAYWDHDIVAYVEGTQPKVIRDRVEIRNPPWELTEFQRRHAHDPMMRGEIPHPGKSWKAKDRKRGYSFRFDAAKFSKMAVYTGHAADVLQEGILIWMDGDVLTHKPIPDRFAERLLGDYDCAYLGREPYHSETGFVIFRLPEALPITRQWAQFYIDDSFIDEDEWHSAYLFDCARQRSSVNCKNLSPGGKKHVWHQTELGVFMDHLKGSRKDLGRSPEAL